MLIRLILFFFLFIGAYSIQAQDVVMTVEKHEQLKKNIVDYKNLIKIHKDLQLKYNAATKENEVHKKRIAELESQLANCANKPKKKNIFKRIGAGLKKVTRKLKPHKNQQNW